MVGRCRRHQTRTKPAKQAKPTTLTDTPRITLTTATAPGAIAIIQLCGAGIERFLGKITNRADWPMRRLRLVDLAGVDQGIAVRLDDRRAQLMPHAGPRVVDRLIEELINAGAEYTADPPAAQLFPEAASEIEADMLVCIARAASPAAIDLLLAQPDNWRRWMDQPDRGAPASVLDQSKTLDKLIDPPCVVVVGRPNVGKSTLTNYLLGRSASLVADMPGTTRDWVGALTELVAACTLNESPWSVAVHWIDTPGLRTADDAAGTLNPNNAPDHVELQAIELAAPIIRNADVVIAMRDPATDWPAPSSLPRDPDLYVINKIDSPRPSDALAADHPTTPISARTGQGIEQLQQQILDRLNLSRRPPETLWAFTPALRDLTAAGDWDGLKRYLGG